MPNLAWLAEIVFYGSYFIAWVSGAFNALTTPGAPHNFIVISAIAALVAAVALLLFNGLPYVSRLRPPAA